MNVGPVSALVVLVACISSIAAAELPAAPRAAPADDVQDFVLLGPLRPIVFRLRVTIDGRPFRQVWQERFDELFGLEDRERDGRVTIEQAETILRDMNGSLAAAPPGAVNDAALRARADANGTIDRQVLLAHIEQSLPPFTVRQRVVVDRMSAQALFPLLDVDCNQQLSPTELAAAEDRVRQRDFDDNRLVTRRELILDPGALAAAAEPSGGETVGNPDGSPVILLSRSTTPDDIAGRLLAHYDRDHDGRASARAAPREIELSASSLGAVDANGDGSLDRTELAKFVELPPDVELPISMGRSSARKDRARPRTRDREFRVRRTLTDGFDLRLGESEIKFYRNNRNPVEADDVNFRTVDRDNNGYLDQNEAKAGNIGTAAFASLDSDGDGKVFKGEFTSFMGRQNAAAAVRLQLEVSDEGQNLFFLLDADNNGVLSPRELKSAAALLNTADKNGDGSLGGDEIPQHLRLELVRGVEASNEARNVPISATASTAKASSTGPTWFRKMDRNNDGDLSPHEFVGSLEAFSKLDTDHDGLIDRQEAESAKP
ncbi:MAG TPA: hypothetical protein VHV08_03635 [Pirellulales bacterium]|nr:hypothetical protein [Pirellulales bacterium]